MSILERIFAKPSEKREQPVTLSDSWMSRMFGWSTYSTAVEIHINEKTAMSVPAFFSAVNFMSGTLASLPIHVYRTSNGEKKRVNNAVSRLLAGPVNDEMTTFDWRKILFSGVFTNGRNCTYIERDAKGAPINLFPMVYESYEIKGDAYNRFYRTKDRAGNVIDYPARDVIDLPFLLGQDMMTHIGPIEAAKEVLALHIAASTYGSKIFKNGGVAPLVITGPFENAASAERAADQVPMALFAASRKGNPALAMPVGHEVKPVGLNAEEMQLLELKQFCVEEIARIFNIPPTFLQDLSNGTHSNTEQQDLHFVKHTVSNWVEQAEQQLTLKLLGRRAQNLSIEFNLDGLLRGDFKTRMEGYRDAVQNGIRTPNEVRRMEGLPPVEGGDKAFIQGATMPLDKQQHATLTNSVVSEGGDDE